jgi:D-arabinose 1-dehydrogenase-like Zn-dependent alcohol dehydrogenase
MKADPKPGETVALEGISGTRYLAIQYSRVSRFKTIAITTKLEKAKLSTQFGVERVVKNGEKLKGVGGADILLAASSSNDAIVDPMKRLQYGGRVVLMGIGVGDELKLDNFATLMNRLQIVAGE